MIGKADGLTIPERIELKDAILDQIKVEKIQIYDFPCLHDESQNKYLNPTPFFKLTPAGLVCPKRTNAILTH